MSNLTPKQLDMLVECPYCKTNARLCYVECFVFCEKCDMQAPDLERHGKETSQSAAFNLWNKLFAHHSSSQQIMPIIAAMNDASQQDSWWSGAKNDSTEKTSSTGEDLEDLPF